MRLLVLLAFAAACGHAQRVPAPTTGGIGGQLRDAITGEAVTGTVTAHDEDGFDVSTVIVAADGSYVIDGLKPGRYGLVVEVLGGPIHFSGVPVDAGRVTAFDLPIDRGAIGGDAVRFADLAGDNISEYAPADLDPARARLEGTVTDSVTRERVEGAVVTTTHPETGETLTAVSDDHGRFEFADVPPGTYTLSAFYQVPRRGQIEVRRADVPVAAGRAVVVPLTIEVTGAS